MNMPNFISISFAIAFVWVLLSVFYNFGVRPVLNDMVRFRLFSLRAKVRDVAIDGREKPSSFNFQYCESFICYMIDSCSWFSAPAFFELLVRGKGDKVPADARRFEEKASDELREIHDESMNQMFLMMVVNSPIIVGTMIAVGLIADKLGKAWTAWIRLKVNLFLMEARESSLCAV